MADKQITPFQLTDQFTMDNFNQRINETNTALQKKADLGEDGKVPAEQVDAYSQSDSISASTRTALSLPDTATPDAALAEIARQLSESGMLQMDLLWENASPSSDFPPQSISFEVNPTDKVIVEFTSWKGFTNGSICSMSELGKDAYGWFFDSPVVNGSFTAWFRAWRVTESGVTIDAGWLKPVVTGGTASSANSHMIPSKIYRLRQS